MKITVMSFFKHKKYLFSLLLVSCAVIFIVKPAYSQIDYSYGRNEKGVRLNFGLGVTSLQTTWDTTPMGFTFLGGLGYDINDYFNISAEAQYGGLSGVDGTNTYSYSKTVVNYYSASVGLRFSIGLFSNFASKNGFTDAVKRSYIGLGYGEILSSVTLTKSNSSFQPYSTIEGATVPTNSMLYKSNGHVGFGIIPLSIGTNIRMPGVLGTDAIELNPNFQFNLLQAYKADGYQPTATSQKGGYAVISLSLRYKL
jgi:hypothetical protein